MVRKFDFYLGLSVYLGVNGEQWSAVFMLAIALLWSLSDAFTTEDDEW